jgi:GntR family transcriptional regulator
MPDPMWKQIAEDLRQKIEGGEIGGDGEPLPTELDLQAMYGASRNTVRDAIKWLAGRNLVYTRSGQGTFVAPKIDPFITTLSSELEEGGAYDIAVREQQRNPEVSVPRVEIQQAKGLIADQLRLAPGGQVVSRHQERRIDAVPYSLQTSFYPMQLVTDGATRLIQAVDIKPGALAYLEEALGIKQAGIRDRIAVRVPDGTETNFFSLPDDGRVAVFQIIRTGYDEAGQPFRVTVTTYPADRNQFLMTSGKVPDEPARPLDDAARSPGDDGSP